MVLFGQDLSSLPRALGQALGYWAEAMLSVLPKRLQRQLSVGEEQIIVRQTDEQLQIYQNRLGVVSTPLNYTRQGDYFDSDAIAKVKAMLNNDHQLILQVADQAVLSKPVHFPAVVANNLRQTVLYEMDKHTPFAPNEVYFDVVVEQQKGNQLATRLYLLHISQVGETLKQFADSGLRFDRLCSVSEPRANLLPQQLRRHERSLPLTRNWGMAAILSLLLVLVLALPLYFKRSTAINLDQQMAALSPQARGESELWQQRDAAEEAITTFINNYPMPFTQIYEELSKRLPDDAWVNNLTYKSGQIVLRGEAADAANLITLINASPIFYNAEIRSPIVKSIGANKEVYNISFSVVTGKEED